MVASQKLDARIASLARERATAVSLRDLFVFGKRSQRSPSVRLQNARFLQRELPIRMAQRIEELKSLPFGLERSPPILKVIDWYSQFVGTLSSLPWLANADDERAFTTIIDQQLQTPSLVVTMLSSAVASGGGATAAASEQQRRFMQSVLDRFFTARIGLRFLMEHHVSSAEPQDDDASGIIRANFDPAGVLRDAAQDAAQLCSYEFGHAPAVEVRLPDVEDAPSTQRNSRLTGVPSHLHYISFELLKNAMHATCARHGANGGSHGDELPPVRVTASFGQEQLSVRISDEGGGIPLVHASRVWRYAYTTAPTPLLDLEPEGGNGDESAPPPHQARSRPALSGYGMGLPLSRLYAQYLGGRLDLRSLEGHGTDAYLYVPRLGSACEALPAMVRLSPAERESTPQPEEHAEHGYALSRLSEYEYAMLSERLAEMRHHAPVRTGQEEEPPFAS